jgi:hypothetical protein
VVNDASVCYGHFVYFVISSIWNNLGQFGLVYGHLDYFFPGFGMLNQGTSGNPGSVLKMRRQYNFILNGKMIRVRVTRLTRLAEFSRKIGRLFSLGSFVENVRSRPNFLATAFQGKSYELVLTKNGLGCIFG